MSENPGHAGLRAAFQDQRDIALLISALNERLDWPYVENWAEVWEVADRLKTFRPEPQPGGEPG